MKRIGTLFASATLLLVISTFGIHVLGSDDGASMIAFVSNKNDPLPETPYGEVLLNDNRVVLVESFPEMQAGFTDGICALIVTRDVARDESVDWDWIREQFDNGVAVGGIGVDIHELYQMLNPSWPETWGMPRDRAGNLKNYGSYDEDRWPYAYFYKKTSVVGRSEEHTSELQSRC